MYCIACNLEAVVDAGLINQEFLLINAAGDKLIISTDVIITGGQTIPFGNASAQETRSFGTAKAQESINIGDAKG